VTVDLSNAAAQVVNANLTLTCPRRTPWRTVTQFLDDRILGNGLANVLSGGPGNDVLVGGAGADTCKAGRAWTCSSRGSAPLLQGNAGDAS